MSLDLRQLPSAKALLPVAGIVLIASGVNLQGLGISFAITNDDPVLALCRQLAGILLLLFSVMYRPKPAGRRATDNYRYITSAQQTVLKYIGQAGQVTFNELLEQFPQYSPEGYLEYRMKVSVLCGAVRWDEEAKTYQLRPEYVEHLSRDETMIGGVR